MARKRQDPAPFFDLGFPLTSRVGRQAASQFLDAIGQQYQALQQRAVEHGNNELNSIYNEYNGLQQAVMTPINQQMDRIQGNYNVLTAAINGHASATLIPTQILADRLGITPRTQSGVYTTFTSPGGPADPPPTELPPGIPIPQPPNQPPRPVQPGAPQGLCYYVAWQMQPNATGPATVATGTVGNCTYVVFTDFCQGPVNFTAYSPPSFAIVGGPFQVMPSQQQIQQAMLTSPAGPGSAGCGVQPPPTQPPPSQPPPTTNCPQCGCPVNVVVNVPPAPVCPSPITGAAPGAGTPPIASPEPPPNPPPIPGPIFGAPGCFTVASLEGGIPTIGSEAWCECLAELTQWISQQGQAIFQALVNNVTPEQIVGTLGAIIPGIPLLGSIISSNGLLGGIVGQVWESVQQTWQGVRQLSAGIIGEQVSLWIGITIAQTVVGFIQNLQVGWVGGPDATVQTTGVLEVIWQLLEKLKSYVWQSSMPDLNAALELYLRGEIKTEHANCLSVLNNHPLWEFHKMAEARRTRPAGIMLDVARNRQLYDHETYDHALRHQGWIHEHERAIADNLRHAVPGPADLVRFAVRHVFEPDLISHFGYNDEYRPVLDAFHRAQGIDYPIFSTVLYNVVTQVETENGLSPGTFVRNYELAGLNEPTWAQAYWWSHWILPSPGQGYQMVQRLRPTGGPGGGPRDPSGQVFTSEDLGLLLRANDYPPYWRGKLEAISYSPPSLRYLRVQLQQGTIDENEAAEELQDIGYRPAMAANMAKALKGQVDQANAKELLAPLKTALRDAWEVGIITDTQYQQYLTQSGIDSNLATAIVQGAVAAQAASVATEMVRALKSAYVRGLQSWEQVNSTLIDVGIVDTARMDYQRIWGVLRSARGRELSASAAQKALLQGFIGIADYVQRLRNMGYPDSDVGVMLQQAQLAQTELAAKVAKQQAEALQRSRNARIAAVKAAQAQLRQQQAALARHGSPKQMATWVLLGYLPEDEYYERTEALGWPKVDATRLLEEVQSTSSSAVAAEIKEAQAAGEAPTFPAPGQPGG